MNPFRQEIPNNYRLPRRIDRLGKLAYDLWWIWNPDAQSLFSLIDKTLWETVDNNPVKFLRQVERPALNAVTQDRYYLELYDRVMGAYDQYRHPETTWFKQRYPDLHDKQIAYFSFEFGLHESLPVYAGGLGILSGDHLKEASDLGLPVVGVGFIYREGYFTQRITEDGWQEISIAQQNFDEMPIIRLTDAEGKPLIVAVDLPGHRVQIRLWQVQVGRIPLYLLDTNVEGNSEPDRQLSARLYSSDPEVRILQELLLGVGGVRALRLLGYQPDMWHMNEGHSAFLTVERIAEMVKGGMEFEQAAEAVRKTTVFTTHTPVPAGSDQFPLWLADKYFEPVWPELKPIQRLINLARQTQPWGESFSMPVLALRLAQHCNAVSELHGQVARQMWHFLWQDRDVEAVPIGHVTNGVHTCTWLARRMGVLFSRHLGADWLSRIDDPNLWTQVGNIPDGELWAVRKHLKRALTTFANERARKQWMLGRIHPVQVIAGGVLLEPSSLTIGFARRFATYKQASLVLRDYQRLLRIINNPRMPVQIIFAGKAHPADEPGKLLIQKVYRQVKDAKAAGRLVFLEDYDMNLARYLVQGVDVWLNTPRRLNEASGTSGMKAAINGGLNFSILDGWWHEAYNGTNGWAIGDQTESSDPNQQDDADAQSLYDVLENEIVPLYYRRRSADKLPVEWLARVKESIRTLTPQFSTQRMVKEYLQQLYLPALHSQPEGIPTEE